MLHPSQWCNKPRQFRGGRNVIVTVASLLQQATRKRRGKEGYYNSRKCCKMTFTWIVGNVASGQQKVVAALPLELDSAFEDFPVFAMLDFVALSSLILAAFSFCESLSDASSSSTMLRAFFCWCVSWAFLFAWVVWAVLLARRVNVSLRWFFRTPVSSAALISVATFSSTSRALEIVYNYHGIMPQSVKELTWEWLQEANAGYLCWCWSNGVEIRLHLLLVVWGPSLQMTFLRDIWWAMGGSSCCWFCGTTMLRGNFVNFHNYKNEIKPWTLDFGIG